MAIVAEVIKQSDLDSGDSKTTVYIVATIYDDTDPKKTPLGGLVELQVDRDGFLNMAKTDADRKTFIAKAINDQCGDKIAEYQKTATVAKSLVGMVVPLTDPKKG